MRSDKLIHAVPTNVITGFLGVGKTSAIMHLMRNKPANENWAVLINEFGEIGIDGSLFEGQYSEEQGVYISEVPGGCMCCAAGLPMQVALNQLLARSQPDRLLIEPTGLGHPEEVLQVLSADDYQDVLSLQKTLTLVDARKLSDPRYNEHDTFKQQIAVADIVVGNKVDLYEETDKDRLIAYVSEHGKADTQVNFSQHAQITASLLEGQSRTTLVHKHQHHHTQPKELLSFAEIPDCGYVKAVNSGEGFYSVGWRFSGEKIFSRHQLFSLLCGLQVERMKAVFITDSGNFGYNFTADALTELKLEDCIESRIEIITEVVDDSFEEKLLSCLSA